jgi:Spy/CpxP family protein refolding chaperone
MWWKVKPLLLLLSLTLNVAFVAGFASRALFASQARTEEPNCSCLLRQKLGATDEEWQRIEPRLTEFRNACKEVCREINLRRSELIELIARTDAKPEAIRDKQEEILAGQRKMQQLVVQHLLAAKEFLTPKQQEVLFGLIRNHCSCEKNLMGFGPSIETRPDHSSRDGSVDCCNS